MRKAAALLLLLIIVLAATLVGFFSSRGHKDIVIATNERVALERLSYLPTLQSLAHTDCLVDQDNDGTGECLFLAELQEAALPRGQSGTTPGSLWLPFLDNPNALRPGILEKAGYCYMLFLPGPNGPMNDTACDGTKTKPGTPLNPQDQAKTIDSQEKYFVAYAWPAKYGKTGLRTFAVDQNERTMCTARMERASEVSFVIPAATGTVALFVALILTALRLSALKARPPLPLIVAMFCLWLLGFAVGFLLRPPGSSFREPVQAYNGTVLVPKPNAAFPKGKRVFSRKLADGEGNDGNIWKPTE